MKYEKIDDKSFKATETETVRHEEIYTVERLVNMWKNINSHIDNLNHELTKAQENLIDCRTLMHKANEFGVSIPPFKEELNP